MIQEVQKKIKKKNRKTNFSNDSNLKSALQYDI